VSEALRRLLWIAPSGRLHHLRSCSGGAGRLRMKATKLTQEQWEAYENKCRCALHITWKTPLDNNAVEGA
jgi:hypothetical protein